MRPIKQNRYSLKQRRRNRVDVSASNQKNIIALRNLFSLVNNENARIVCLFSLGISVNIEILERFIFCSRNIYRLKINNAEGRLKIRKSYHEMNVYFY